MKLHELLNNALSLMQKEKTSEKIASYPKVWIDKDEIIYITKDNIEKFYGILDQIYSVKSNIYTRFTRKKIYKFIEEELVSKRRNNQVLSQQESESFFTKFENQKPCSKYVIAPISGIRLDHKDKIVISIFEIGRQNRLKSILSNDNNEYYIAVKINNIYDELVAIDEAKNKFSDFIRLIVFISGKNDKSVLIKTGLPSYPSLSHEQMYVETSSYQIVDNIDDKFPASSINNKFIEKIPVDNNFFANNEDFEKLWDIYERKNSSKRVSDMELRLLNAAISIGESSLSKNIKNSIIYTSMALEILFSFDEGSLFQKSIGEKLSDIFAFLVGKDKDSRLKASKAIKEFYRLRSALVHGGSKKVNNDYIAFNMYLRAIIRDFLNDDKLREIKNINGLYQMIKEAQYSY